MDSKSSAALKDVTLADLPRTCLIDKTECNTIYACNIEGRLYCLKAAPFEDAASLLREKDALQALSEVDGIAHLVNTFKDDTHAYILKRFICGCSVEKLFYAVPRIPLKIALHITGQVALILRDIHSKGWVYRDLKANNVVLNKSGEVFLIDMGHCTPLDTAGTALPCGAYHARSPEVFGGMADTVQLDAWSLGILLFELLTGRPPFGFLDSDEEVRRCVTWDGEAPREAVAPVVAVAGEPVAQLVASLLHTDAAGRCLIEGLLAHPVLAGSGAAARGRCGLALPEAITEEVEMQSLGKDEGVAPPTVWQ